MTRGATIRSVLVASALVLLSGPFIDRTNAATTIRVATGLERPVDLAAPPGDDRFYVLSQYGRITVHDADDASLLGTFLDISDRVVTGGHADERGLLGIAFPPDHADTGIFYLAYSDATPATVISRFVRSSSDPDVADPADEEVLLRVGQPFSNHNGGRLDFGPDGYLYVGTGDGGSGDDPGNRAQNPFTLLGKLLRLDVSGGMGSGYAVPPSNPFVDAGGLPEIWAYGLRNPWGVSFDAVTGDLYVADVGQGTWEEINVQPAASTGGENYGWRRMEGRHCHIPSSDCNDGGLVLPVHEYGHGGHCSVTGGVVYRGSVAELGGEYLFADYCSADIWGLRWTATGGVSQVVDRTLAFVPDVGTITSISGFGVDGRGEVYVIERGSAAPASGELFRIVDDATGTGGAPAFPELVYAAPNPLRTVTRLTVSLPAERPITVTVHDVAGRTVATLVDHAVVSGRLAWDGSADDGTDVASGMYFVRVTDGDREASTRVSVVR